MPQFVDADGIGVFVEPPLVITADLKKKFQDVMIIKLMRFGLSMVDIAKLLNMSEALVRHRFDGMPGDRIKYYARCDALAELG